MDININGFEKLTGVVELVLGTLTGNYFYRRKTKDIASRIKQISEAVSDSSAIANVMFENDGLAISPLNPAFQKIRQLPPKDLAERTDQRLSFQAQEQQLNLENIVRGAAEILVKEGNVSNDQVDKDWSIRFFDIAKNVSTEELQFLWGKILAGEVKEPNSFSLRTLEIIRNLSKSEAALINNLANYVFKDGNNTFFAKAPLDHLIEMKKISHSEIFLLVEIGILQAVEGFGTGIVYKENAMEPHTLFSYGDVGFQLDFTSEVTGGEFFLDIRPFSTVGSEIMSIIETKVDVDFLEYAVKNIEVRDNSKNTKLKLKTDKRI